MLESLAATGTRVSLSGTDWKIHEDPLSQGMDREFFNADLTAPGWIPAQVPGNIQADVEAAHQVGPLWYGAVNTNLYEVARKDWWYRKDFVVPASYSGRRLTLDFDGVEEHCKVWLNGTLIGENGGMFRRFCLDVSAVAVPGQTNHLAVQINRMPEVLMPMIVGSDGAYNGPVAGLMDRTREVLKDLKPSGGDGLPLTHWSANETYWALGIWKDDAPWMASGPARIDWTRVETTLSSNYTHATVHARHWKLTAFPIFQCWQTFASRVMKPMCHHARGCDPLTKGSNVIKAEMSLEHTGIVQVAQRHQGEQALYRALTPRLSGADSGTMVDKSLYPFWSAGIAVGVYVQGATGPNPTDILDF